MPTKKRRGRIALIIPTLNEAPAVGLLLRSIPSRVYGMTVTPLVIDGGSTDGTQEIVRKARVQLVKQKGVGKGAAMLEAAANTEADIVCFVDGDDTYSVQDLAKLIHPILRAGADMVIASRMLAKREHGSISTFNMLGNRLSNKLTNFALKTSFTDILSGFRAVRGEALKQLFISTSGFEIEAEMTIEAVSKNLKVLEVPITEYRKRSNTSTKLNPIRDGYNIFKLLILVLLSTRPMLFFGIASLALLLLGLYPWSLVLYEKLTTGTVIHLASVVFASMLWLLASVLFVFGVIAQMLTVNRRRLEYLLLHLGSS